MRPEDLLSLAWVDQIFHIPQDDNIPAPRAEAQTRIETPLEGGSIWKTVGRYEWDEWGPQNTRWFEDRVSTNWQHAIHGLRTAECVPEGERNEDAHAHAHAHGHQHQHWGHMTGTRKLRIRDFNPNVVKGAIFANENEQKVEDKNKWKVVTTEDPVANTKNVFEIEILSALPYREVVTEESVQVAEVMMDESRILLIKVRELRSSEPPRRPSRPNCAQQDGTLRGIDVLEFS